jgi:hypothetical protein
MFSALLNALFDHRGVSRFQFLFANRAKRFLTTTGYSQDQDHHGNNDA